MKRKESGQIPVEKVPAALEHRKGDAWMEHKIHWHMLKMKWQEHARNHTTKAKDLCHQYTGLGKFFYISH